MKVFIAALCLVGTISLQEESEFRFINIERFWTICTNNKVFYTRNQSEPIQDIELKQTIDPSHQLLASVELTHKDSGKVVYSAESLKICNNDDYSKDDLHFFVTRFFKVAMLEQYAWHWCPIHPAKYEINRFIDPWAVMLPNKIPNGHYELSYIIKWYDGELVFSPLKFKFLSKDVTPKPRV